MSGFILSLLTSYCNIVHFPAFTRTIALAFAVIAVVMVIMAVMKLCSMRLRSAQVPATCKAKDHRQKKIIIFYSSIGYGHISAAQAIREEIIQQDPKAAVVLQDIREFMHPLWRRIDEKLYWLVAGNFPELFDALFHDIQARGNSVSSLALLPNDYPEKKVLAFLRAQAPDTVLATHYGSAQVLGNLREHGLLTDVKIGWLHTDFFQGYFPRISKRIDQTFLAHPELEMHWLSAGVPSDKVTTTGMPVCIPDNDHRSRETVFAELGLVPDLATVLITSGKEGVGDYVALIKGILYYYRGAVQIIAICGKNTRQQALLETLQNRLSNMVKLKVFGLVSHDDLLAWMRLADVLITKAGGLTPVEAFTLGTPTILLDVVSGHERENAALFARLGVAKLAADATQAGELTHTLLLDPEQREAMCHAQKEFRENSKIAKIAQFALDDTFIPSHLSPDFGAENGKPVLNIKEALAQLDAQSPAEVELLLSYATSQSPQRIVLENPFGHIAIRIGPTVYSANYIADPSIDPNFLQNMSLADYLYGVRPPSPSQVHTNTYGMAYGRETIGLRIAGIPSEHIAAMTAEVHRIEDEFKRGRLRWNKAKFNCADVVGRILGTSGYGDSRLYYGLKLPSMPLDSFEKARVIFEKNPSFQTELVAYRMIPGSRASYHFSRFPLSIKQPLRSLVQVANDGPNNPLEESITKHLTGYFGDRRLYFENLHTNLAGLPLDESTHFLYLQRHLYEALVADLRRLLTAKARVPLQGLQNSATFCDAKEICHLLDQTFNLARIATERAEDILKERGARRLRTLFSALVDEYSQIGSPWRMKIPKIEAYLKRLEIFEATVTREFSPRWVRLTQILSIWYSLWHRLSHHQQSKK